MDQRPDVIPNILVSAEMCKTPGSRIGSENEFSTWKAQVVSDMRCVLHPVTRLGKNAKKKPRVVVSRCNMRAHAQTHAYVCRCRHCCEGYDAGALCCVVGVCRATQIAQHGRCVCVQPMCIALVCVCVCWWWWGADLNDQPAKVDGARKPDKARNKRLNLSRS